MHPATANTAKAKFHYAIWSQTGSKLVRFEAGRRPAARARRQAKFLLTVGLRPASNLSANRSATRLDQVREPTRTWSQTGSKPNSVTLSHCLSWWSLKTELNLRLLAMLTSVLLRHITMQHRKFICKCQFDHACKK